MKVVKSLKNGVKGIKVIWKGEEHELNFLLSRAMTGTTGEAEEGICTSNPEAVKIPFLLNHCEREIQFSPVEDWWDLSAQEIGEILISRAERVRNWVKAQNFVEEATFNVPWEAQASRLTE